MKFKREFKFLIKKKNFKFKKFKILLKIYYSIKNLINFYKIIKLNNFKIKSTLLINNNYYFNYITNGLDLKYDNTFQNFELNTLSIKNYKNKNLIISNNNQLDIIKFQKFLFIIDNKYVNSLICDNLFDFFFISIILTNSLILEFYKNIILINLIKIN
uniref:Ymf74 n=1 Tax=Tetrahymena thermophila TaxID=5911 RepID=Q951B5_TETTH|nr:ymf74 [Tetrahymena thermophila]AAK77568.1 ymf74 [Tetrahymena thermophila]